MMVKRKDPKDFLPKGRPTDYTTELGQRICKLISTHPFGLPTLIEQYNLPDRQSIYNWLNTYPDFFDNYMKAKHDQAHILADEILVVAKEIPTLIDKEGNVRIDSGMLGRAKLQMDALRWSAGKLAPKWYADNKTEQVQNNEVHEDAIKRKKELDAKNKKEF
jgi:hypothetical protein